MIFMMYLNQSIALLHQTYKTLLKDCIIDSVMDDNINIKIKVQFLIWYQLY